MCSSGLPEMAAGFPYGLKVPTPGVHFPPQLANGQAVPQGLTMLDLQRAQLYDYTARLQYAAGFRGYHPASAFHHPYHHHGNDALAFLYGKHDPRARFVHEEPKPSHSYIGLIAMAILSSPEKKLVLSDIYQWILDNYSYFRNRGPGWRNSIRHNLSLNDCFVKSGRSANGKGHYWAIHPANVEDFKKGDFRRRRAQRRVRKHMGLAVPDEDDSPSPSPSPSSPEWQGQNMPLDCSDSRSERSSEDSPLSLHSPVLGSTSPPVMPIKKRMFDVESLLAPDEEDKSSPEYQAKRARINRGGSDYFTDMKDQNEHSHTNHSVRDSRMLSVKIPSPRVYGSLQKASPIGLYPLRRSAFHFTGSSLQSMNDSISPCGQFMSPKSNTTETRHVLSNQPSEESPVRWRETVSRIMAKGLSE